MFISKRGLIAILLIFSTSALAYGVTKLNATNSSDLISDSQTILLASNSANQGTVVSGIPTDPNERNELEYKLSVVQYRLIMSGLSPPNISEYQQATLELCLIDCWYQFDSIDYCSKRLDILKLHYNICNYSNEGLQQWSKDRKALMKSWLDKHRPKIMK
jgi:hypothetical protein